MGTSSVPCLLQRWVCQQWVHRKIAAGDPVSGGGAVTMTSALPSSWLRTPHRVSQTLGFPVTYVWSAWFSGLLGEPGRGGEFQSLRKQTFQPKSGALARTAHPLTPVTFGAPGTLSLLNCRLMSVLLSGRLLQFALWIT